jgi:hypothetical protein
VRVSFQVTRPREVTSTPRFGVETP